MRNVKKLISRWALCLSILFLASNLFTPQLNAQPRNVDNYEVFYNDLAPYGHWLNDPQYGYVWTPNVERGFRPYYTNGHWAMTEYGNMWVSNYRWGWAPFHYGRWVLSSYYGWVWIPGNQWGPAWVTWRHGNGYYGWAPMSPGISINISFGSNYYLPNPYWTFIPQRYIYTSSFQRYYSPRRTSTIIHNTTIINNVYVDKSRHNTYVAGPRRSDVERATGRNVPVYNVSPRRSAGAPSVRGNEVSVYRPQIENNTRGRSNAAPRNAEAIKHPIVSPVESNNSRTSNRVQPAEQRSSNDNTPQRGNINRDRESNEKRVNPVQSIHPKRTSPQRLPEKKQQRTRPEPKDREINRRPPQRMPQHSNQRTTRPIHNVPPVERHSSSRNTHIREQSNERSNNAPVERNSRGTSRTSAVRR